MRSPSLLVSCMLFSISIFRASAAPLLHHDRRSLAPGRARAECLAHVPPADRAALEAGILAARSALVPRSAYPAALNETGAGSTTTSPAFTFDVAFTVVHANATRAGGWVAPAQFVEQVRVLNADFAGTGIAWRLAGARWVRSADWFVNAYPGSDQEQAMKRLYNVGDAATMNVYTLAFNSSTASLGTASIPSAYYRAPHADGVLLRHGTVAGGERAHYNLGRTLTHEAGHWLGLFHTFEGGCDDGVGDNVADTPPAASGSEGCPVGRDSCPGDGPDLVDNFMDYSYDACMRAFTSGQAARMRDAAWAFRRPGARVAPPERTRAGGATTASPTANVSAGASITVGTGSAHAAAPTGV